MVRFDTRGVVSGLRLVRDGLLDLIYPPQCLVCEQPARPVLCGQCAGAFVPLPDPVCACCGRPVQEPVACRSCAQAELRGGWGFDTARAAGVFQGPLRHAIHRLKYARIEALGDPLGAFLANRCVADGLLSRPVDVVVSVPIHRGRRRWRGFNQADVLAAPISAMLGVPFAPGALVRARKTPAQVTLPFEARRTNVEGAFQISERAAIAGRRVLLVDDVLTTGATVSACAWALKEAGAATVVVATLAAGG